MNSLNDWHAKHIFLIWEDIVKQSRVNYIIRYNFLNKTFNFKITTGVFWPEEPEFEVYTDDSKMSDRVGCGCVIECPEIKVSYRQFEHGNFENFLIYSGRSAMTKSLMNVVSTSVLILECRGFFGKISEHSKVLAMWVPVHRDIVKNSTAV